jgi:peptidoglycan/LPS O-acetylase OafA/YrhL
MVTPPGPVVKSRSRSWIKGLDSIRFVLALIVLLSHLKDPFHDFWIHSPNLVLRLIGSLPGVLFSGIGSVMAFFIISGFVIHYPNKDAYPDTKSFLIRRWLRIGLPLLVIALISGIFHQFSAIPVWSLYCELIYYTLYPVLIRIKLSWFHKFLLSFILSIVLIGLSAHNDWASLIHHRNINYSGAYWQSGDLLTWIIGLPCWILGVILAEHIDADVQKISAMRAWTFRVGVLLAGILLSILKFHFFVSYIFSMNVLAILLYFWIRNEILYFKERQPMRLLEFSGRFSYSLYLTHGVFIFFIGMVFPVTVYSYFPVILLTLLSSYLYYLLVERPSHLLSRKLARQADAWNIAINYK